MELLEPQHLHQHLHRLPFSLDTSALLQADCFSFRLMWAPEGAVQGYVYALPDLQDPAFWGLPDTRLDGEVSELALLHSSRPPRLLLQRGRSRQH